MRLLLILALVIASASFGPPAMARAHGSPVHDHAAMNHSSQHGSGREQRDGSGPVHAAVHVCPGCAVMDPELVADRAPSSPALPRLPVDPASLSSFDANPIPPPPRLA